MTVSEKLRLVYGLHSHAEMFGFHWDDGSDWTWHDVACKVADEVDAENAKLREERDTYRDLVDYMVHHDIPDQLAAENAKLREMLAKGNEELAKMGRVIEYLRFFVKARGVDAEDMRELGVEE